MNSLLKDLQYAYRMLRKSPGFTIVAVITLALGLGANTAIFSVVNAVLLRSSPYNDPDSLMIVGESNYETDADRISMAPANYLDYRDQNSSFQNIAAYRINTKTGFNLTSGGEPERVTGAYVSANLFPTLGINPVFGRAFQPEEEKRGNNYSVILSYGLWQRRFGASPAIIDQMISLNGNNYKVVGVMPRNFQFPTNDIMTGGIALARAVDLWVPLSLSDQAWTSRGSRYLYAIGRLKSGVSVERAQSDLSIIANRLGQEHIQVKDWAAKVVPFHEQSVGSIRLALLVIFGAVGFVLLIACTNVANLLLSRAVSRQQEIALRTAFGASRKRLIQQLLTESILLAVVGGVVGLALAYGGLHLLAALIPNTVPNTQSLSLDGRVVAFTAIISLVTAIIFGLVPALQASRTDISQCLKESGRVTSGAATHRLRSLLIISEIALAMVLLIGAGLMIKSFVRVGNVAPGFDPNGVLTFQLSLPVEQYDDPKAVSFFTQLNERIKNMSGVQSASGTTALPMEGASNYTSYLIKGDPPLPPGQFLLAEHIGIFPGYFQTMRVPMLAGRDFTQQDTLQSAPVMIINEAMAKLHWPNEDPIGKQVLIDQDSGIAREIIGVVSNVRHFGLDAGLKPEMYVSQYQFPFGETYMVMRTTGNPLALTSAATRQVLEIDPHQPIYNFDTMENMITTSLARRRFTMLLMSIFAVIAAILAAIGLYGVMAHSVVQRTHEIGIRMALGAQRTDIFSMVIKNGLRMTLVGVAIGLVGAFVLTRVISSLLFGVSATDPWTFMGISLLLIGVAVISSFIPARKAVSIQPMEALRYQ